MKSISLNLFPIAALIMIHSCAGASVSKKSDVKLNSEGLCVEQADWMEGCNHCFCPENGVPACTLMSCPQLELLKKREIKEDATGPKEEECVPGTRWMKDCNSCFCTKGGATACTEIGCLKLTVIGE